MYLFSSLLLRPSHSQVFQCAKIEGEGIRVFITCVMSFTYIGGRQRGEGPLNEICI